MKARPVFSLTLSAMCAALLLALPGWAEEAPVKTLPTLLESVDIEAVEATPVPEPRSIFFVGVGGLVLLAFALRRK